MKDQSNVKHYEYPEGYEGHIISWVHDEMQFTIVNGGYIPHLCGYVRFKSKFIKEPKYWGILTYVPVHGGITYFHEETDGSVVYGFDCGHAGDDKNSKYQDPEWVGEEAWRMGRAILLAAKYEDRYLAVGEEDSKERAIILDEYHAELKEQKIEFVLNDNFGAMINSLFGKL